MAIANCVLCLSGSCAQGWWVSDATIHKCACATWPNANHPLSERWDIGMPPCSPWVCPKVLEWFIGMAGGNGGMGDLIEVLRSPFQRLDELDRMGIIVSRGELSDDDLQGDSELLLYQQDLYNRLVTYLLCTLKHLLLGFAHLWAGYPGKFALLHHPCEAVQQQALRRMEMDWKAWLQVRDNPNTFWKRVAQRSMMGTTAVSEVFEALVAASWRTTDEIKAATLRMFSHFGTSLPAEIAFQNLTDAKRDQSSGVLAPHSLWRKPVARQVLSNGFKFAEVDGDGEQDIEYTRKNQLPDSCFKPVLQQLDEQFRDLPGVGRPKWPTFAPSAQAFFVAEMCMTTELYKSDSLGLVGSAWQAALMREGTYLMDKQKRLWLCIANTPAAPLLLPVDKVRVGPFECLSLRRWHPDSVGWQTCFDVADWCAIPTSPVSPMKLIQMSKNRDPAEWPACYAYAAGKPVALVRYAAMHGFWDIDDRTLHKLQEKLFPRAFEWGDSKPGWNLLQLIQLVLKCSVEKAAGYLTHRIKLQQGRCYSGYHELLKSKDAEMAMNSSELQECNKTIQDEEKQTAAGGSLRAVVKEALAKARKKGPRPHVQTALPDDDAEFSEATVQRYLPPGGRLVRSYKDGRWRGSWKFNSEAPWTHMSRAWGHRTHKECIREILSAMWADAELHGHHCFVEGLDGLEL